MYETFEIDRSGRIATIWMNRLSVFNAFNKQLIVDLGMVNEVIPDDALDANVATLAEALIAGESGEGSDYGRQRTAHRRCWYLRNGTTRCPVAGNG